MKFRFDDGYYYLILQEEISADINAKFLVKFGGLYIYSVREVPRIKCRNGQYLMHYLDHFLLIIPDDYYQQEELWRDFYKCFGSYYEYLINNESNIECIRTLLKYIHNQKKIKKTDVILDFGCGSGLATKVSTPAKILGYEPVDEMRVQAQQRGMKLLTKEDIYYLQENTFDAVFSSYVFHMVVCEEDIALILSKMKKDALWIANFYKNINIEYINTIFRKYGYTPKKLKIEERYGAMYEYRK